MARAEVPHRAALPDPEGAFALTTEELERAVRRAEEDLEEGRADAEAVRRGRRGAELARIWAMREPDGPALDRARTLLRRAAADPGVRGACDAALERARLEARDAGDLPRAHRLARRIVQRFAGRSGAARCVAEARQMARMLRKARPRPGDGRGGTEADASPPAGPHPVIVADAEPKPSRRGPGARGDKGFPTILLDPGHGGDDRGARHGGLVEARVALDVTRRAARLLAKRLPRARVLMTRHGDDFVSLEQRTAMANAADADVFVSVHLNAADETVERGGVATFVLDVGNDEQALRLAARENGTTMEEVTGLQRILAGLVRRHQSDGSRRLAQTVHGALLARARQVLPKLPDRGVKEAMFYVLVGARMPAVLVEASFLTHPAEARMLRTDRYRQALGDGIAEGILRHVQSTVR